MREEAFYLPAVGRLHARFFDESEAVFSALERAGEIERLRRLPQLGIVQRQWESANHSRWAYIVLMLNLVSRSFDIPSIRLGSSVRLPGQAPVSSARELLRCWILLANTGHLWWTFTAERALLEELNETRPAADAARNELLAVAAGRGASVEAWASGIFDRNRSYQLYQLIALYRLPRILQGLAAEQTERYRALLLALVVDDYATSLQIRRARHAFRRLRRLAFLSLDAEYTPSALHISLSRVINDLSALERLLTADDGEPDELSSLDRYLTSNVYLGEEVLRDTAAIRRPLRERIRSALDSHGLRYTLAQMTEPSWYSAITPARIQKVARLHWEGQGSTSLPPELGDPIRLAADLQRTSGSLRLSTQAACEADPTSSVLVIQTHAVSGSVRGSAAALYLAIDWFERAMAHTRTQMPRIDGVPVAYINNWRAGGDHGRQLINSALRIFFEPELSWEWDRDSFPVLTLCGSRSDLDSCLDFVKGTDVSPARLHEVASVGIALARVSSTFYIAGLGNLRAYRAGDRTPAAEIDGLALSIDRARRALRLTIVEAKMQRRRGISECRRELENKIRVLGVAREVARGSSSERSEGQRSSAWTHLRLAYAR